MSSAWRCVAEGAVEMRLPPFPLGYLRRQTNKTFITGFQVQVKVVKSQAPLQLLTLDFHLIYCDMDEGG